MNQEDKSDKQTSTDAAMNALFDELETLLAILNNPKIKDVPEKTQILPLILIKVEELAKWSKEFEQTANTYILSSQISKEEISNIIQGSSRDLPAEKRALIERGNRLRQNILTAMANLNIPVEPATEEPSSHKTEYEKIQNTQRDRKTEKTRLRKFKKFKS